MYEVYTLTNKGWAYFREYPNPVKAQFVVDKLRQVGYQSQMVRGVHIPRPRR